MGMGMGIGVGLVMRDKWGGVGADGVGSERMADASQRRANTGAASTDRSECRTLSSRGADHEDQPSVCSVCHLSVSCAVSAAATWRRRWWSVCHSM